MSLRRSPARTERFLAANRANARKSTGPRTERGKQRVRFNALRHGFRSSRFGEALEVRGKDREDATLFESLRSELMQIHRTTGLTQEEIEGLAKIYWYEAQRLKACKRRGGRS
jgi:hypothetical protein